MLIPLILTGIHTLEKKKSANPVMTKIRRTYPGVTLGRKKERMLGLMKGYFRFFFKAFLIASFFATFSK